MKHLTCRQIGGPCDTIITADTPDAMAKAASEHMINEAKTDPAHQEAVKKMEAIYNDPKKHTEWEQGFQELWDATPNL